MIQQKNATVADRLTTAAKAKQAMLERFRARPGPDDPEVQAQQAARKAIAEARDARSAASPARPRLPASPPKRLPRLSAAACRLLPMPLRPRLLPSAPPSCRPCKRLRATPSMLPGRPAAARPAGPDPRKRPADASPLAFFVGG